MSALSNHEAAINRRITTERHMGQRWNDVVYQAIDRAVLSRIVEEEKLYRQRLSDLEQVNNRAMVRLATIRSSPMR